ncbi:ribosomal protein S9/S16-domain-containing protein [Kickxella alabastrina]|uniref:ribosomal protein S9/S16-domain-containing protein n=1 Tax=Kickxella alabastrina TaxID=61397 RepID=UPI00221F7149|nr:ribosomal protein S9/S16-domain-containing protein [Kickxella alabastrina]KAI7825074.1 ribosomal protein S9/S16-domain-containing protein [Kickxella alabastrina]KAJ1941885.1 37S ribosomal protein S9, mitochondrial [Kickxella alabastrina]
MLARLTTRPLALLQMRQPTVSAMRLLSTHQAVSPFDTLDIRPIQRPDTAAYFMPKPKYADLLSAITTIIQQHKLPEHNKSNFKRGKWIGRKVFDSQHAIKMNANEYILLTERLNQADSLKIADFGERETVGLYLNQFRRGYSHVEVVGMDGKAKEEDKVKKIKVNTSWKRGMLDHMGRWRAAGKRKEAIACAWLVPIGAKAEATEVTEAKAETVEAKAEVKPETAEAEADSEAKADSEAATFSESTNFDSIDAPSPAFTSIGQVLVNGKPLPEYFVRPTDRESVLFPFHVANKTGQYNVFVRVRGGGHTGQAEACQLAIARALYAANRKQNAAIRTAGLLFTDGRRVERKKTGKPKARKSYTWVKR